LSSDTLRSNAWLLAPALLLAWLGLARLARLRPALRPLLLPSAATAVAVTLFVGLEMGRLRSMGWPSLLYLIPLLVLLVRVGVIAFDGLLRRRRGSAPPALLSSLVAVVLYAIGAGIVAHRALGFELTPFLATSAVVGAVVGLALQDTLGNLFAGIALHSEAPFHVGEWVRLGESEGQVEQVSWRAMRLRTWYGDTLTIPNSEVARHAVLNFSAPAAPHARMLRIGVNYHTPPNKVIAVLGNVLEQVPGMPADPPPSVRIVGYRDFTIEYEVVYRVPSYEEYRRVEGDVHRLVWYHFRRHGIEIPFPIRNVYLHTPALAAAEGSSSRLERALRGIDLFRPLSDEELKTAASRFQHLHYAAGEEVIEEGAAGDSFFVVDRGEVEVRKTMGGRVQPVARLMEGQFFGEMALLTGETRAATVVAATDVDVFTIDKAGFHDVLVANPTIAVDISAILADRREALSQVEGDLHASLGAAHGSGELKQRILDRIRSYFGL
jgi:small-conductance mechanosensitive channel/CRP-like cAMP-binding protein